MRALLRRYWVGELILAGVFGSVVLLALLMTPHPDVLTLFGVEVPVLCGMRLLTGTECFGCGLTRSFAYMAHGQVLEAWHMHRVGPVLFLAFASQVPYRLYTAGRDLLGLRESAGSRTTSKRHP